MKLYLSELKMQLDIIEQEIAEIIHRGFTDCWGTKIKACDKTEYKALVARRREIRRQIIHYKPQ